MATCPGQRQSVSSMAPPLTWREKYGQFCIACQKNIGGISQKRAIADPGRISVWLASWLSRPLHRSLVVRIAAMETANMALHH
jgi:hypothetical protein